jgi:hypothetical protein
VGRQISWRGSPALPGSRKLPGIGLAPVRKRGLTPSIQGVRPLFRTGVEELLTKQGVLFSLQIVANHCNSLHRAGFIARGVCDMQTKKQTTGERLRSRWSG